MFRIKKTSTSNARMCEACGLNPQYHDKKTGKLHLYCSKACASTVPGVATAACDYCKRRPRSGRDLFCSKKCAAEAKQKKIELCSLTGCKNRATTHPSGTYWNYCSPRHEGLAQMGCIYCRAVPHIGDYSPLCTPCDSYLVGNAGPILLPVPQDHATYWFVVDQFNTAWAHAKDLPDIRMVYRIIPAPNVWDNYWAYRDLLEAEGGFAAQGKKAGNEKFLWHGTVRACHLGEPGQHSFCTNQGCSLCSIARGSFDLEYANTSVWQRYGPGIYTSTKSSKSHDYVENKVESSWKAMLLNNVLAGLEYVTRFNQSDLSGPPWGYDSVYGEPGEDLNYDELVVYTDHAIRPAYLVMYE